MRTRIHQRLEGDVIIELSGSLDYEGVQELINHLGHLFRRTQLPRIIFNLKDLDFVGSTGITNFIYTLKEFNLKATPRPLYIHVRSEFRKIIEAFDQSQSFEIIEAEDIRSELWATESPEP